MVNDGTNGCLNCHETVAGITAQDLSGVSVLKCDGDGAMKQAVESCDDGNL